MSESDFPCPPWNIFEAWQKTKLFSIYLLWLHLPSITKKFKSTIFLLFPIVDEPARRSSNLKSPEWLRYNGMTRNKCNCKIRTVSIIIYKSIYLSMFQHKVLMAGYPTLCFVIIPSLFLTFNILMLKWLFFSFIMKNYS